MCTRLSGKWWGVLLTPLVVVSVWSVSTAWAMAPASDLVGRMMSDFSLPSQQDRLVVYEDDYYGKHHLILTFFPAAFTPV